MSSKRPVRRSPPGLPQKQRQQRDEVPVSSITSPQSHTTTPLHDSALPLCSPLKPVKQKFVYSTPERPRKNKQPNSFKKTHFVTPFQFSSARTL